MVVEIRFMRYEKKTQKVQNMLVVRGVFEINGDSRRRHNQKSASSFSRNSVSNAE